MLYLMFGGIFFTPNYVAEIHLCLWSSSVPSFLTAIYYSIVYMDYDLFC